MRIRLRPYHPTYVISFIGGGYEVTGPKWANVMEKVKNDPDIEIELVEEHDDVCLDCHRRMKNETGCVWSTDHTCVSAERPDIVEGVKRANARFLKDLELELGSVIRLKDLAKKLREKIPVLDDQVTNILPSASIAISELSLVLSLKAASFVMRL